MPKLQDIDEVLSLQNPWHGTGTVPPSFIYSNQRYFAQTFWRAVLNAKRNRYHLILGPRRIGKTTVMYQTVQRLIAEGIEPRRLWWIRLDHPVLTSVSLGDLAKTVVARANSTKEQPAYLFLDELNYAQQWDLWLKTFYDEQWPIKIVATSSSTAALSKQRVESGVGRWEEHFLPPCSFGEYLELRGFEPLPSPTTSASLTQTLTEDSREPGLPGTPHPLAAQVLRELHRYLLIGGFPELINGLPGASLESEVLRSQEILKADAVERAIYKDIPQAFGVQEPIRLERLLYTIAGQAGGIVSSSNLAKSLGLSQPSVDKYLGHFERSYLIMLLANYARSEETIQRRGRKLYFLDGAVRNASLLRGISVMNDHHELGLLFENAVAAHVFALGTLTGVRVYHWRKADHYEVDCIYDHPTEPVAFEIKSSPHDRHKGLSALQQEYPKFEGRCFIVAPGHPAQHPDVTSNKMGRISTEVLLLIISAHIRQAITDRFIR